MRVFFPMGSAAMHVGHFSGLPRVLPAKNHEYGPLKWPPACNELIRMHKRTDAEETYKLSTSRSRAACVPAVKNSSRGGSMAG